MVVMLVPTVTPVRVELLKKAASPMVVMGRPLAVLGMTTAPPGPGYCAMFREPSLLVVNVYGACAITGGARNRRSSKHFAAQAIFDVCGFFILHRFSMKSDFKTSEIKSSLDASAPVRSSKTSPAILKGMFSDSVKPSTKPSIT